MIDAATFGGRPDILLAAFPWCLAEHDRDPDRFDLKDLLWKYKWVVGNIVEFPHISREQIESMLANMSERFEKAGSTLHAVHQSRQDILADMGSFGIVEGNAASESPSSTASINGAQRLSAS